MSTTSSSLCRAPVLRAKAPAVRGPAGRPATFGASRPSRPVRLTTVSALNEVADKYSMALVELAQDKGSAAEVAADMDALASILKGNKELQAYLASPVNDNKGKVAAVAKIAAAAKMTKISTNFVNVLIAKGRAGWLEDICAAYEERYCALTNTTVAEVTSAVELNEAQQASIAKKIQKMTGAKNIKLKGSIDEELDVLGPRHFDSNEIDLSVARQLNDLTAAFN